MNSIKIRDANFASEPGIKFVRETVFIKEQHVPVDLEWDNDDQTAQHVIAKTENGDVIATARLLNNGHIGRMAVLEPFRFQGIGTKMLNRLIEKARQNGLKDVFLNAQISAVNFYTKAGFCIVGNEFMDAGIPHYKMVKKL